MLLALIVALVLFLIAGWVIGFAVHLLWLFLAGLVIGALARLVIPGEQRMSVVTTGLYGIAGSFLGSLIARIFGFGGFLQFVLGVVVAVVLIVVVGAGYKATDSSDSPTI